MRLSIGLMLSSLILLGSAQAYAVSHCKGASVAVENGSSAYYDFNVYSQDQLTCSGADCSVKAGEQPSIKHSNMTPESAPIYYSDPPIDGFTCIPVPSVVQFHHVKSNTTFYTLLTSTFLQSANNPLVLLTGTNSVDLYNCPRHNLAKKCTLVESMNVEPETPPSSTTKTKSTAPTNSTS